MSSIPGAFPFLRWERMSKTSFGVVCSVLNDRVFWGRDNLSGKEVPQFGKIVWLLKKPFSTSAFSKSVVAVISLLISLGITVCLDFPCTSFMCCQKDFDAVSEGWSLVWRNNFVACARSLFLNKCVTLLRNCLNLSCVSAVVSFLIFLNADRFALIAVSISGVTYGFFGLIFLTIFDGICCATIPKNLDVHIEKASLTSSVWRAWSQSAFTKIELRSSKSTRSYRQIRLLVVELFTFWCTDRSSSQKTHRWSDEPSGGSVSVDKTSWGTFVITRSSSESRRPSDRSRVGVETHWRRPSWRKSGANSLPATLLESDGNHSGDLALKSPTTTMLEWWHFWMVSSKLCMKVGRSLDGGL